MQSGDSVILRRAFAGVLLCFAALSACAQESGFLGKWTIERADSAPWNKADYAPDKSIADAYIGKTVTFEANRIDGPELLACANPKYVFAEVPAEGLFQGGLAESDAQIPQARETATKMGFKTQPIRTAATGCEHDIAFHMSDEDHAAFALDNWIFWMKRVR
jgi:hypothetical protein